MRASAVPVVAGRQRIPRAWHLHRRTRRAGNGCDPASLLRCTGQTPVRTAWCSLPCLATTVRCALGLCKCVWWCGARVPATNAHVGLPRHADATVSCVTAGCSRVERLLFRGRAGRVPASGAWLVTPGVSGGYRAGPQVLRRPADCHLPRERPLPVCSPTQRHDGSDCVLPTACVPDDATMECARPPPTSQLLTGRSPPPPPAQAFPTATTHLSLWWPQCRQSRLACSTRQQISGCWSGCTAATRTHR